MKRRIGLVLGILLVIEIIVAVGIVLAQPGGFSNLTAGEWGPERTQEIPPRLLELNGQPTNLTIANASGQVEVVADASLSGMQIRATKVIRGNEKNFDRFNLVVVQSGNNISLSGKRDNDQFLFDMGQALRIRVEAPPALIAGLIAEVGSSDLVVTGFQSLGEKVRLTTGSGDITVNEVRATRLNLKTGSGDIRANKFSGGLVAETGSGEISVTEGSELNEVRLMTGSGDIRVSARLTTTADGSLRTGSGQVRLNLEGGKVPGFDVGTGSGDIRLNLPGISFLQNEKRAVKTGGAPVFNVRTGSGNITISQ